MKHGFILGLAIGLVMGVIFGFFTSHFWGWILVAVTVGLAIVVAQTWRPKRLPGSTAN